MGEDRGYQHTSDFEALQRHGYDLQQLFEREREQRAMHQDTTNERIDSLQRSVQIFESLIRKEIDERSKDNKRIWQSIETHTHDVAAQIIDSDGAKAQGCATSMQSLPPAGHISLAAVESNVASLPAEAKAGAGYAESNKSNLQSPTLPIFLRQPDANNYHNAAPTVRIAEEPMIQDQLAMSGAVRGVATPPQPQGLLGCMSPMRPVSIHSRSPATP